MERRPTSILTTLAVSVLALTLIAPWVLGQDPDPITEIRRNADRRLKGNGDQQAFGIELARKIHKRQCAIPIPWQSNPAVIWRHVMAA